MRRTIIAVAIALLLSTLLLAACMASFAYNRLDWLIPWWVDGYVDLTRDQRQIPGSALKNLLVSNRFANAHVQHHLLQARNLHDVRVAELFGEIALDNVLVLQLQPRNVNLLSHR